ncbi:MAG TPA: RDD family protein [Thermoanaerobaculia bacterium]|nr:RDD family protein [Thermoanaerobaculia bacterium]
MDEIQVEAADFGIRFVARLVDYLPVILAGGLSLAIASAVATGPVPAENDDSLVIRIGFLVATILYHAFSESIGGASLGKRLFGLEVVSEDLRPATLLQGWKRSLAFVVDGFFFGLVGYNAMKKSPIRQRIGDGWAKTRVVLRRSLPPALRRPTSIFVFSLFGALGIAAEGFALVQLCATWF